ncbi:MAG: Holliday junction resolvase RuvX [bacterium]
MKVNRILAIDYGTKRMGLAMSDPLGILAQRLPTIHYRQLSEALEEIGKIVSENSVSQIIVGNPISLNGAANRTAQKAHEFSRILQEKVNLPVKLWDERLTSVQSERAMIEMGESPGRNKAKIDQLAALFLLQNYLDSRQHSKSTQ